MAIDSNDQQVTSEMSRRLEQVSITDQEYHDDFESPPISDYWQSESPYVSGFPFDPSSEPNTKSGYYISEPMHESTVFDRILTIQDTTDIRSEGSSVYPVPPPKTSLNGMDWPLVEV